MGMRLTVGTHLAEDDVSLPRIGNPPPRYSPQKSLVEM